MPMQLNYIYEVHYFLKKNLPYSDLFIPLFYLYSQYQINSKYFYMDS